MTDQADTTVSVTAQRWVTVINRAALPVLVGTALLVGGVSRSPLFGHVIVQCLAVLAILWVIWGPRTGDLTRAGWAGVGITTAFIVAAGVQLIPLPPEIWTSLPGRASIAEGFALAGGPTPMAPISLTPEETRDSIFGLLPPFAAFLLAGTALTNRPWLPTVIVCVAVLSVLLAIAQKIGGPNAPVFPLASQDRNQAPGLFVNVNHQATLMVASLAFAAALAAKAKVAELNRQPNWGWLLGIAAAGGLLMLGAVLAGSMAGWAMLGPTVIVCLTIALGGDKKPILHWGVPTALAGLLIVGAVAASSPAFKSLGAGDLLGGNASRDVLFPLTIEAAATYFPFGSGLGSFATVFPFFEGELPLNQTTAPHAHNEYLELAMELGLPGLLLIVAGLTWYVWVTVQIWRRHGGFDVRLRKAASVALGLMLLHSMVDYPMRMAGLAVLAGACAGLLAAPLESRQSRRRSRKATTDLDGAGGRHVEI